MFKTLVMPFTSVKLVLSLRTRCLQVDWVFCPYLIAWVFQSWGCSPTSKTDFSNIFSTQVHVFLAQWFLVEGTVVIMIKINVHVYGVKKKIIEWDNPNLCSIHARAFFKHIYLHVLLYARVLLIKSNLLTFHFKSGNMQIRSTIVLVGRLFLWPYQN